MKDPIGFGGGINQYVYVSNDPVDLIDPFGLSEQDVQLINQQMQSYVQTQVENGNRYPGSGRINGGINNILSTYGKGYAGCIGQACGLSYELQSSNLLNEYEANWNFQVSQTYFPLPHKFIMGYSDDPNDPILKIDPHRNEFNELKLDPNYSKYECY